MSVRQCYGSGAGSSTSGSTSWTNLANWSADSLADAQTGAPQYPITSLPANGDQVWTDGSLTDGPGDMLDLAIMDNTAVGDNADSMSYNNIELQPLANGGGTANLQNCTWAAGCHAGQTLSLAYNDQTTDNAGGVDGGMYNAIGPFGTSGSLTGGTSAFTEGAYYRGDPATPCLVTMDSISANAQGNSWSMLNLVGAGVRLVLNGFAFIESSLLSTPAQTLNTANSYSAGDGNPIQGTDIGEAAQLFLDRTIIASNQNRILTGSNLGALGNPTGSATAGGGGGSQVAGIDSTFQKLIPD